MKTLLSYLWLSPVLLIFAFLQTADAQTLCGVTGQISVLPSSLSSITVGDGETLTVNSPFTFATLMIDQGGELILQPGAELIVKDEPINTATDPEQLGHGIIVRGSIAARGTQKSSFRRATAGIPKGATSCELDAAPIGWNVDDRLAIPDTRQKVNGKKVDLTNQSEIVALTAINGSHIKFTPTAFAHQAGPRANLTPHVANVTRDIVIRSQNPSGVRGHLICLAGAQVKICYCQFENMGRTNKRIPLDVTVGTHVGTNQIGRYPLHLHLMGQTEAKVENNVVVGSPGWGIVVHGTQGALVLDNVCYDILGSAFVGEDGSEASTFDRNLAMFCKSGLNPQKGGVIRGHDFNGVEVQNVATDGSGFWFRGLGNNVRNNVAAGCAFAGFNWNGYYRARNPVPAGEATGNECYSSAMHTWITWPRGGITDEPQFTNLYARTEFSNFTGWHLWQFGLECYHTANHTFRDWTLLNDPAISNKSFGSHPAEGRFNAGMNLAHSYENGGMIIDGCEVRGFNAAITAPANFKGGPQFIVRNCTLQAYVNLSQSPINADFPGETSLENVTFIPSGMTRPLQSTAWPATETDVWMRPGKELKLVKVRLLDTKEKVYLPTDPAAPCQTTRARIVGNVCGGK